MTDVDGSDPDTAGLLALRAEIEAAHEHVQRAQALVYDSTGRCPKINLRARLAIDRAQDTLIRLLVLEDWPPE